MNLKIEIHLHLQYIMYLFIYVLACMKDSCMGLKGCWLKMGIRSSFFFIIDHLSKEIFLNFLGVVCHFNIGGYSYYCGVRLKQKFSYKISPSFIAKLRFQVSELARAFLKNPAPIDIQLIRPFLSAGASWVLPRSTIRCLDVNYTSQGFKRAYNLAI